MDNSESVLFTILMIAISGFLVGVIARWLLPGPDPMSWLRTILVGVAGSFLGAVIGRLVGYNPTEPSVLMLALAIGGAILILLLYRWLGRRSAG